MILLGYTDNYGIFFQAMESLGMSPGALPLGGSDFPVGMSFP